MRILWLSNPPWVGSGYGEQTALFTRRLVERGHEVGIAANFGLAGARITWEAMTVYPADADWGNEALALNARHLEAELAIALADAWVMKPDAWPDLELAIWAPVDHYPIPPPVLAVLAHERVRPIAMSRFGEELMRQAELDPCYVPHGVDTELFKPQPELREQVREQLGIPADVFLAGMVAANRGHPAMHRKAFPQALHAFSIFARQHEDAWLYVHAEAKPGPGGGIDLDVLAEVVGAPPGRVRFPPDGVWRHGIPKEAVALIYQAFDVLLMPSMGEGFGIPLVEAQACGVPVITSRHSAMTELCEAGWLVEGDPWYDASQQSFFIAPAIESVVAALENSYAARDDLELRRRARLFAEGYDADLVTECYWLPTLERLAEPRARVPMPTNGAVKLNRAARRRKAKARA